VLFHRDPDDKVHDGLIGRTELSGEVHLLRFSLLPPNQAMNPALVPNTNTEEEEVLTSHHHATKSSRIGLNVAPTPSPTSPWSASWVSPTRMTTAPTALCSRTSMLSAAASPTPTQTTPRSWVWRFANRCGTSRSSSRRTMTDTCPVRGESLTRRGSWHGHWRPRRFTVPTGILARHAGHGHHGKEERQGPHGGHDHREALHLHHFLGPPPSAWPRCVTMPSLEKLHYHPDRACLQRLRTQATQCYWS
jgi:hypothetical protein